MCLPESSVKSHDIWDTSTTNLLALGMGDPQSEALSTLYYIYKEIE